jgi:hypothetical protein
MSQDRALGATAALLRQGSVLHLTTLALMVPTVVIGPSVGLAIVSVGIVACETWFALRVGLDARLFERLAEEARDGTLDLAAFDAGLVEAGLLESLPPNRTVRGRVAGAVGLLKLQAGLVVAQGGLAVVAAVIG